LAYFVYILECSDGTYYTGVTNNLQRRLSEYETGTSEDSYTFSRRPIHLKWGGSFTRVEQAIEKEKQLKKWSKAKKLALINEDWERVQNLTRKKFK